VKFSRDVRSCCGHSVDVSYDGYCTLLTCDCICRVHCLHLQVTVPFEARLGERHGLPLFGWCRHCRSEVGDGHIRKLRPQRDRRAAIYWLGKSDASEELEAIAAAGADAEARIASSVDSQLSLFSR
jgi:hypothetical protein